MLKYFIIVYLLLSTAFSGWSQDCSLHLSGHVEDADTRDKLTAATVLIRETSKQVVTDAKGDFVFEGLCAGSYSVLITHINCESVERKITLTKDFHFDVLLPHARKTLGDVTLEAQKGISNTGFKKELSGTALQATRGQSLAEALSNINGVTMLQTGSTISKPVIHGLHSSRILTINNGVRQEGQQWGNEHAPEIDPFIADKLTVIKGVDELRYGSDAIGGVILVEPKALRSLPGYAAEINTAYFTNNRQYVVSAQFEQQLKKQPAFRYRIQGTFKKGANATTPNYRLNNTASEEKNFSLTAGWKKDRFNSELFYSHFATTVGIFTGSHIGNLTDLQEAIAAGKPADVYLGQNTYKINRPYQQVAHHLVKSTTTLYKDGHKFTLLLAGQFNQRKEFDIVRNSANRSPQLDLSIFTLTEDLSWEHPKKNNFSGTGGLSMMQQDNSYSGRYFIPNYFSYTFGGYYIEKWKRHHWELQGGIRYDNKTIDTRRLKFNGDTINFNFNFSTLAASFNTIYTPSEEWRLNANISLASRAPYVNELLSDGIHHGTATYEQGDITLSPEKSVNITAGINYQHPSNLVSIDLLLYSNHIKDFIYQQPLPDNPVLTISGAFPLVQYQQTDAVLSGFDIAATIKPVAQLAYTPKVSFLYARNRRLNDWLILMPANRLSNAFTYTFREGRKLSDSYITAEMTNVFRQSRVPADLNGKQDYKVPPQGYHLVNLHAATTFTIQQVPVTVIAGVSNLLNTAYRDYLNSMRYFADEMGRNISIRLKISL